MEDDLDLRLYIKALIKHRWIILAMVILCAVPVLLFHFFLSTPVYQAKAHILITPTRSEINFDPRFVTLDSDTAAALSSSSESARRAALTTLVESGAVASQVVEELAGQLEPSMQNPSRLLEFVDASLVGASGSSASSGSLIEISVLSEKPTQAMLIANTWARISEKYINDLHNKQPEATLSLQQQTASARQAYEESQEALATFTAETQIGDLQRQITETAQLIDTLQNNRQSAFVEWAETERLTLRQLYDTQIKLEQHLADARALKSQIEQSEQPSYESNELALMLLKTEVFASTQNLPTNLQLQVDLGSDESASSEGQLADVEALIDVIEARLQEIEVEIAQHSAALLTGTGWNAEEGAPAQANDGGTGAGNASPAQTLDTTLDDLQAKLGQLQAELAREQGRQQELTRARDLAWDTYSTLQLKSVERNIAAEMMDVEVRFAAAAIEPLFPVGSGLYQTLAIACLVGLLLGVGCALLLEYLYPEYDSSAQIRAYFRRLRRKDPLVETSTEEAAQEAKS